MADVALGAIELVVNLIRAEARLHGEMEEHARFVADEMESMISHLRHLVELGVGAGNHQARTWTKQVMEFAIDSKQCVNEFSQSRSRADRLAPWRLADRRQLADRMKNLKARARDIAERLQRYAVTAQVQTGRVSEVPDFVSNTPMPNDAYRRRILTGPYMVTEGTEELTCWLKKEASIEERGQKPRVIAITDGANGDALAEQVYNRSSDEKLFDLKAHVIIQRPPHHNQVLLDMLRQLVGMDLVDTYFFSGKDKPWPLSALYRWMYRAKGVDIDDLPDYLKGKKLLVVLSGLDYPEIWTQHIKVALEKFRCSDGSAVVFSTKVREVAQECSAKEFSLVDFHLKKAMPHPAGPVPANNISDHLPIIEDILQLCNNPDVDCANMFLRALCSKPNWTERYLKSLLTTLEDPQQSTKAKQDRMIDFSYEGLPKDYRICLWYSAFCIPLSYQAGAGRAGLVRRWRAEGLITTEDRSSELEEAEHCFDTLITHKLLFPCKIGGTGKIKSFAVHHSAVEIMTNKIPALEDLVLTNQLPIDSDSMLFSLRNACQLHQSNSAVLLQNESQLHQSNSTVPLQNESLSNSIRRKKTMDFLKCLNASPTSQLVSVLDLEDCKGLKGHHLDNICETRKLKYLSLRNTGVARLPSEMRRLSLLETLDIRQTRVRALNAVLPKLKHLLAGCTNHPREDTNVNSKESFSTVRMLEPEQVRKMEDLEILSHVKVSDSAKQLVNVGEKLKKLRKLGVVFSGGKAILEDVFRLIDTCNIDLRSLSIKMDKPGDWATVDSTSLTLSGFLESLNICNITGGLPHQIKELHKLAKITLRNTLLKDNALDILGNLTALRCLKLRFHSFAEGTLTFGNGQFSSLMELVVQDEIITSITFSTETAPKLVEMFWTFSSMKFLSGVQKLPNLSYLEFNGGSCDSVGLKELQGHIQGTGIKLKLNLPENGPAH